MADGWRLQARQSQNLTVKAIAEGMLEAIRSNYVQPSTEKADLFISYARNDRERLYRLFSLSFLGGKRKNWFDEYFLSPGIEWSTAIDLLLCSQTAY